MIRNSTELENAKLEALLKIAGALKLIALCLPQPKTKSWWGRLLGR